MEKKVLKEIITNYLKVEKKVIMGFLYGSYANDTALYDSDLDMAIYFDASTTQNEIDRLWDEIQRLTGKDVEILSLNNANESVAWQAICGIPLVIKDWDCYLDYMLRVSLLAMDFQKDLEEMWLIKKNLKYA